jgi:hypothetical protein
MKNCLKTRIYNSLGAQRVEFTVLWRWNIWCDLAKVNAAAG